ncbi:MAG: hypothetical protein HC933_15835 [Pleurocapsa sp. SU_196_0]|nr:hypothetical protein [Pleurocapsa sp. SU_196_0]
MNHREIRNLVLGVLIGASGLTALAAFSEFQAGTPIRAADVNAKFNDLDARVTARQARISAVCAEGSSIRAVAADGTVTCEADDVGTGGTGFTTGAGLNLTGGVLGITDGGITRGKLNTTGTVAPGKLLRATADGLEWADDGLKLPFSGTISAADAGSIGLSVVSSDPNKTAMKGLGGNYGVVGDTLSPTGVGVLAANSGSAGGAALEVSGGIKVSGGNKPAFVHQAIASNSFGNYTCINNALTNNRPNAILIVTQNFNPNGTLVDSGVYNDESIGVFYGTSSLDPVAFNKWCIFNQDTSSLIPVNADFNVLVFNQ